MAALPFQGQLNLPIQWSGTVSKTTMMTGSFPISGTIGLHPWREQATLTWTLSIADAQALIANLKAGKFNAVYDYDCNIFGAVKLRPTDSYGFGERGLKQFITVTVTFERVSA